MYKYVLWLILYITFIDAITQKQLNTHLKQTNPFQYDLGVVIIPGKHNDAQTTIVCHGYGHSNKLAKMVASLYIIPDHIVGFNFPDYNCLNRPHDVQSSYFGTIDEILPLLFVIKKAVIDANQDIINLYGFSAGGGAIINALNILNQDTYDKQLQEIGINTTHKRKMINAISHGLIILDCPLKSIEEIIKVRGDDPDLKILDARYKANQMNPIDVLGQLNGLSSNIIIHFQDPDEILGNIDDQVYINRLQEANKNGKTHVVLGKEGGHNSFHRSLWDYYKKLKK